MSRLVGVGGIYVPSESVNTLERELNQLCVAAGFPSGEEFKWSPGRDDWMYDGLTGRHRAEFFSQVLRTSLERGVSAAITMSDTGSKHPRTCRSHEEFAIQLLIERIEWLASRRGRDVVVVFDRPGGARADEENFLADCLEVIQSGTPYLRPQRIALNALSTSSHFVRLLQTADLVTGCVTAYVAGEPRFSPELVELVRPMLVTNGDRIGGFGIKIHPDYWYANLYHWLFGDSHLWRGNIGHPLPAPSHPYGRTPNEK
jgi:hypothetical protein